MELERKLHAKNSKLQYSHQYYYNHCNCCYDKYYWPILNYTTSQNKPKQPKTGQNDPKQAKTTQNEPKWPKTTQNNSKQGKKRPKKSQQEPKGDLK